MTIFAPLLGMLWRTLESYEIDPRRVIRAEIYRPGSGAVAGERISAAEYNELLTRAASLVSDPAIGLRAADKLHPSHLGALGHAWMASSSLRTAIYRSKRYHRMLNESVIMDVSQSPGVLVVEYNLKDSVPVPDEQADSLLGSLVNLCRFNFGDELTPAFVRMRRTAPVRPDAWTDYFGTEVTFEQQRNCLAIHNCDADKQLTGSSQQLVAINEELLQRSMVELDRKDIVNRTRVAILDQLPSGQLSGEQVAAQMNLTRRTLHNKLGSYELSFSDLVTEVRKELAHRYLVDCSYSITETSFLLGYADSSAFSRAFRSWFGVSPSEYRDAHGAGHA